MVNYSGCRKTTEILEKNKKVVDKRLQVRYNKQAVAKRQQTGTLIIEQQPSLKIQNKIFRANIVNSSNRS